MPDISSKQLTYEDQPLFPDDPVSTDMLLDKDWVKIAFMVPDSDIGDSVDVVNRYYTTASAKFTDTRLGCSIGVNPKPQWTRYCDPPNPGRMAGRDAVTISSTSGNFGMGDAYSEGLDDPAQKIFMRFGVPQFNSLLGFLNKAFSRDLTILARTGRAPSAFYNLSKLVGTALSAIAFPALTVTVYTGRAVAWMINRPTSKFFTLKPTMYLYWNTVQNLVINHAVNTGLIKKVMDTTEQQRLGRPYIIDDTQLAALNNLFPDTMFKNGTFDILSMVTKAQRLANQQFEYDYNRLGRDSATDFEGYLKRDMTGDGSHTTAVSDKRGEPTLSAMFNNMMMMGKYYTVENGEDYMTEVDPRTDKDGEPSKEGLGSVLMDHINSMRNYADAEFRDGAEYAVFQVEHTGSMQESFGSSYGESQISQKLNDISSTFKQARFSLAEGNILGSVFETAKNAVSDIAIGTLDGVTMGFAGLAAGLGGSGYIDIPKHWESSNANLPRGQYTFKLISPYNNPVSRMMDIWIPFYMLLAGAMPRSVGKQSYTSPFYCQLFDRGRVQSRLAAIESISITRGTSNLQFDLWGQCLAIDVSITVVDLSTIMHMPVSSGELLNYDTTMDEDNILADYLNVLAGMDIYSQIYPIPRAQLQFTKELAKAKYKATSPAFHTAMFKNAITDGFINDITLGASGLLYELGTAPMKGTSIILDGSRL